MKLFLQKKAKFSSAGGFTPKPLASGGWGSAPRPPKQSPPMRISGYAPADKEVATQRQTLKHAENIEDKTAIFISTVATPKSDLPIALFLANSPS